MKKQQIYSGLDYVLVTYLNISFVHLLECQLFSEKTKQLRKQIIICFQGTICAIDLVWLLLLVCNKEMWCYQNLLIYIHLRYRFLKLLIFAPMDSKIIMQALAVIGPKIQILNWP